MPSFACLRLQTTPSVHACVSKARGKVKSQIRGAHVREGAENQGKIEMSLVTSKVSSGYLPTLDGWRTVAILWVLMGHSHVWRYGWFSNEWLFATGGRGVQLFFALSGFLICNRLLREEQRFGGISLRSFYTRRFFRIQPAALTYLTVISILMLLGPLPRAWPAIAGSALMVRSFLPRRSMSWETAHFWSLAVEEQFYLFLPGFLVLCHRYRLALISSLVVIFEVWRVIVMETPRLQGFTPLIYLRTDTVIAEIFLGCAFALALNREKVMEFAKRFLYPWMTLLFTAAVYARITFHHSRSDHALGITVYPLLLVSTMLHPASLTSRFLELAPMRFVGRISYSLYLWQELFFNPFNAPGLGNFRSHTLLCWGAAFGCAIASYYLIEKPLIRYGHRIARKFDLAERETSQGLAHAETAGAQ
jgi:peptidoglycan/LPS O-acetylase OafA/YrhL